MKESLQYHIAITEKVRKITDSADFRARWQLERQMLEGNDDGVNIIFQKIVERENLEEVLRLVCLRSAVNNGFREKDFNKIRTEVRVLWLLLSTPPFGLGLPDTEHLRTTAPVWNVSL